MKHLTRGLAGIIAATMAIGTAPAYAHTRTHDSIRYASIKGCAHKKVGQVPCSPWRLFTHDGKTLLLEDAQVTATDARGRPAQGTLGPLSVSGDGRYVAYFRA